MLISRVLRQGVSSCRIQIGTLDDSYTMSSAQQQGSNRNSQGSSISAFLSTLLPIIVVSSAIFLVFLIVRGRFNRVYQPRTYLQTLDKGQRTPKQTPGFLGWLQEFKSLPDDYVVRHSSLDNYLWLRFFKMLTAMCFVGCIVTWPVLFPVAATGGGGQSGLDILSFSNVGGIYRYFAFAIMSWIFLGFVMYMITRESMFYINLRQAYFLSPYNVSRISSRTVLFVDVPETYRDEKHLRHILPDIRHVWLTYKVDELEDMIDDRTDAATKLENAELKMIGQYVQKQHKQGNSGDERVEGRSGSFVVDKKNRPTHRLKPLIGQKVDTIDWSRGQLHDLNPRIAHKQREHCDKQSAVFVEFETVRAAQSAFQMVANQQALHMTAKEIGMTPDTVLWKNLGRNWKEVRVKSALGVAFMTFLCIFWTIPVAFIGILTNVNYLTNLVPFLSFINNIPSQILGIVTGLLPVLLLAILMKLVPIFAAMIARTFEPTESAVQMRVQSWYFPFEVIQVFLITTFTSAASSVVTQIISHPTSAPQLLASNLPKASNFYIAYFILKGLLTAALQIVNIAPLLFVVVLGKILDKTPRKKYNRYVGLGGLNWGVLYPSFTNLGVIGKSGHSLRDNRNQMANQVHSALILLHRSAGPGLRNDWLWYFIPRFPIQRALRPRHPNRHERRSLCTRSPAAYCRCLPIRVLPDRVVCNRRVKGSR